MTLSLVQELQRDALDGDVSVSDVLRKAYAVAMKLRLDKFKQWAALELNGYLGQDVPNYRRIGCSIRAWNPRRGWQPTFFADPDFARQLSVHEERAPVGAIYDLASNERQGDLI